MDQRDGTVPDADVRRAPRRTLRGVAAVLLLGGVSVTAVGSFTPRAPLAQVPHGSPNSMVRGYLAAAVGGSSQAEQSGLFSRGVPARNVYLPGVEVYLMDVGTAAASRTSRTDLSGRFTVSAPNRRPHLICWRSPVYGAGCDGRLVTAGAAPQFVSTVLVRVPPRPDHTAFVGRVSTADGAIPRLFDPLMNINAFATVGLDDAKGNRLASVYVNNFGDYLLPYVPVKQHVTITARMESGTLTQEVRPEAEIEKAALHRVNLRLTNHRPRLDPVLAFDTGGRRVQNAAPGSVIVARANARDRDGDSARYVWFPGEGAGQVSATTGPSVQWSLPAVPGRYSLTVVAYDDKGGYDKAVLSVLADGGGVPFSGIVVEPDGTPVAAATVEIVGSPTVTTDARGRFQTRVKEADRYVFNVRKDGYATNSRVYDRGMTGGRWILRRGQIVVIDPTRAVRVTHRRGERDCPGPDSQRGSLGPAGASLNVPQWQDGQGNAVDPPSWWTGPRPAGPRSVVKVAARRAYETRDRRQPVVLPRDLKLPKCGPGITVDIPANSIVDAGGRAATAPLRMTVATVDLLSPQQMPGDDSVIRGGGGGGVLQSFGAGSVDLPADFKLKPGAKATITIPVDRARLIGGAPLPAKVPFLTYDDRTGHWKEEGALTLTTVGGVRSYVGTTTHFSALNADNVFTNASCIRIFSPTLPPVYDLEVSAPLGGTGAPVIVKKQVTQDASGENVVYNLPNNVNVTFAPMTQGSNPQLLGFYIVNSGAPQNPNTAPAVPPGPPYASCQNFVVFKVGEAPESPFGGEFLHGLGYIEGANLGFDDLTAAGPTGNALKDAVVNAARAYYDSVDPPKDRDTFAKFKSKHGFSSDPANPAPGEIVSQYANSGDLGFGRDMHCLKNGGGNVACYVTNYGSGYANSFPGAGTDDQDDANAAGTRATFGQSAEIATVAMEYAPIEGDAVGDQVVKFFVYKKGLANYGRSISANLDGRGERPVPQLCMVCHGGQIPSQGGTLAAPAFSTAADVKLNSRFIPFDYRFFTFPTSPANLTKADQETRIKDLNQQIVAFAPPAGSSDPIVEVIAGLYSGPPNSPQQPDALPAGWIASASANKPNQDVFYRQVVAPACRTCHASQLFPQLQFNTSDKLVNLTGGGLNNRLMLGTAQLRVCGDYTMAHALRTHEIFWDVYWQVLSWGAPPAPPMRQALENFGNGVGGPTWKTGLCTTFLSSLVQSPSYFYEQAIQPIFNGKCVSCHITGGIASFLKLTQGDSYANLVDGIHVIAGNANNTDGILLQRITGAGPGSKMPLSCVDPPTVPGPGQLPCLPQSDIDRVKAWIRSGAN